VFLATKLVVLRDFEGAFEEAREALSVCERDKGESFTHAMRMVRIHDFLGGICEAQGARESSRYNSMKAREVFRTLNKEQGGRFEQDYAAFLTNMCTRLINLNYAKDALRTVNEVVLIYRLRSHSSASRPVCAISSAQKTPLVPWTRRC
jgi:hypothetical protein